MAEYARLVDEDSLAKIPAVTGPLLTYLNSEDSSSEVNLDGLKAATAADTPTAISSTLQTYSFTAPGSVGDTPIGVLCRRLLSPDKFPTKAADVPKMVRYLAQAHPPSLLAGGRTWYKGVVRAVNKSATTKGGATYDVFAQTMAVEVMFRAVDASCVDFTGAEQGEGAEVMISPPRSGECQPQTALHLLCSDTQLRPETFDEALETMLSTIEAHALDRSALAGYGGARDAPEPVRAVVPPLHILAWNDTHLRESTFLRLLAFAPSAALEVCTNSQTRLCQVLLMNKKATVPMLEAVLRHDASALDASPAGVSYLFWSTVWKVSAVDEAAQTADLQMDPHFYSELEPDIKGISWAQLRALDAPDWAARPVPTPGLFVYPDRAPRLNTSAILLAGALETSEIYESEQKMQQCVDRARTMWTFLLAHLPHAALAHTDQPSGANGTSPLHSLVMLPPPVLSAVLETLPHTLLVAMATKATDKDNCNPAHTMARGSPKFEPSVELFQRVLALRPGMLEQPTDNQKETPLHGACKLSKLTVEFLEELMKAGPSAATLVELRHDKAGDTPLHHLCNQRTALGHERLNRLVTAYVALAPGSVDAENNKGQTPPECIFDEPNLAAIDFEPFIRTSPNPLQPCVSLASRLSRAARRQPRRREMLNRVAESLRDISNRIVRSFPDCSLPKGLSETSGLIYPLDDSSVTKAFFLPEELAPPDLPQVPGPLALAVQSGDIDFCSAPSVRAFVEDFFTGPMSIDKPPPYFEREPLQLPCLPQLPKLREAYETYRNLCDNGDLEWPKPLLSIIYCLTIVAYRPALAFSVPLIRLVFEVLIYLCVTAALFVASPLEEAVISSSEWFIYLFCLGAILQEVSECASYGVERYMRNPFNLVDALIIISFSASFALRVAQWPDASATEVSSMEDDTEPPLILSMAAAPFAFGSIFVGLRLLPTLQHFQSLGSLVGVIFAMFGLMANFLIVMAVMLLGFIVAMYGLVSHADPHYSTYLATFSTLFYAVLGDFGDATAFDEHIDEPWINATAHLVMSVYLLTLMLLCLNLLIAFLTDAYTQVSDDKDKAFATSRASAVVDIGQAMRNGMLQAPLNLLQFPTTLLSAVGVVRTPKATNANVALIVFTLTLPPLAMILQLVTVVLASPVLLFLTVSLGQRGYYLEEAGRRVPNLPRALKEVGKNFLLLTLLQPISLFHELYVAALRFTQSHFIEPGEWCVVLDTKSHQCFNGLMRSFDPADNLRSHIVEFVGPGMERTDCWVTATPEMLSVEVFHLLLGRAGAVDAERWALWSRTRASNEPPQGISEAMSSLPALSPEPLWAAHLRLTKLQFEHGAKLAAVKELHNKRKSSANERPSNGDGGGKANEGEAAPPMFAVGDRVSCALDRTIEAYAGDGLQGGHFWYGLPTVHEAIWDDEDGMWKYTLKMQPNYPGSMQTLSDVMESAMHSQKDVLALSEGKTALSKVIDNAIRVEQTDPAEELAARLQLNAKLKLNAVYKTIKKLESRMHERDAKIEERGARMEKMLADVIQKSAGR